jgi:uncharacterized membrane protein YqjE
MKTWFNLQLEILKRKLIKLGKLLLSLLVVYLTVKYDAFWITIPTVVFYHIVMIPTYWKRYLDKQRAKYRAHLAMVDKDAKHWKVEHKERFGYKL